MTMIAASDVAVGLELVYAKIPGRSGVKSVIDLGLLRLEAEKALPALSSGPHHKVR